MVDITNDDLLYALRDSTCYEGSSGFQIEYIQIPAIARSLTKVLCNDTYTILAVDTDTHTNLVFKQHARSAEEAWAQIESSNTWKNVALNLIAVIAGDVQLEQLPGYRQPLDESLTVSESQLGL